MVDILAILGTIIFFVVLFIGGCKIAYKLNTTLDGQIHENVRPATQEELQFFHDRYVIGGGRVGSPQYDRQINEWCKKLTCIDGTIVNKEKEIDSNQEYFGTELVFTTQFTDGIKHNDNSFIGLHFDKTKDIEIGREVTGYCVADEKGLNHLMGIALKQDTLRPFMNAKE